MTRALQVRLRRCVLFVPGDRPDRYEKALASGADSVCVDLEDGVGPGQKDSARGSALEYLATRMKNSGELILRINSLRTETGLRDLLALRECTAPPDALMIPKAESSAEVGWVEELLPPSFSDVPFIVMVESVRGVAAVDEIGRASDRIVALFLGGVDLSAELGCTREWDGLLYSRSRLVHAAAAAAVETIDMPFLDVRDIEGVKREAAAAARLGFSGKAAIHPSQVAPINAAFSPTPDDIVRARRIVEAYEGQGGGVLLVDGALVERPVVRAALRTLAYAERSKLPGDGHR